MSKEFCLVIAGGREFANYQLVEEAYRLSGFAPTEIVSGGARGVDKLGERLARSLHLPIKLFKADWTRHGLKAGPIRNKAMAEYGHGLLLIWDGNSTGSWSMLSHSFRNKLKIYIYMPPNLHMQK